MKKVLIIIYGLLFNLSVVADPFGLELGMKVSDFSEGDIKEAGLVGLYEIVPPNENSLFYYYLGLILPVAGLCRVSAITPNIDIYSGTGDELKSKFNEIESLLNEKYGKGNRFDYLKADRDSNRDSKLNKPNDWVTAIRQNERVFKTFWPGLYKDAILPDYIEAIKLILSINAIYVDETSSGYVMIQYDFTNIEFCLKEKKAEEEFLIKEKRAKEKSSL